MGQCLNVLSWGGRRSEVQSLKVKKRENAGRKKDRSVGNLKEKAEEAKLGIEENGNCHRNLESDIEVNSILSLSEESFILDEPGDQDQMNIQDTKEDATKRNEKTETDDSKNNAVKSTMEVESQDGHLPTAASGKSSATNNNNCRIILVKSAKEENFSFASWNNMAASRAMQKPKLPPLKTQKTTFVYPYQVHEEVKVVKKERRDVTEKLPESSSNTVALPSRGEIIKEVPKITDNKKFVKSVEKEDEHKSEDKIKAKQLKEEYLLGLNHEQVLETKTNHEQVLETKTKEQNNESNVPRNAANAPVREKKETKNCKNPVDESLDKNRMKEYQRQDSKDKKSGKDQKASCKNENMMRIAHLCVQNQLFGYTEGEEEVSPDLTKPNKVLAVDAKQKMLATNEGGHIKTKLKSSKVSSTCVNPSSEGSTKNKHGGDAPYWALPDIPSTSWNKQPCLTYTVDKVNVQTEMKNIDSEMAALLKPDEKTVQKTSITFTICEGEKSRPQTPQRLAIKQRTEVDQEKIHEKQKNAERRRNENIAKRIQSARRRSEPKDVPDRKTEQSNNTMERMGAAIARRDEILNQRALVAQKSSQLKTGVIQSREMETAKVIERVVEKMGSATARRHDIIEQRVQTAMKSSKLRNNTEEDREVEMERTKELVFEKMEEATVRRNAILNQRVQTVKMCSASKGDIVKERQVKMAEIQQQDFQKKLEKTQDNRERILRKKVRRQVELEKRRELARRNLARMRREQEEEHLQFVELETYEDQSDDGENVWE